jgi:monooxygenase
MDHLDVVIVGAGISGIGAACHMEDHCPGKSYALLESRQALGGTWDLFRYPGIRSDSDMHTLGFSFKPWRAAKSIADGASIRDYLHEAVDEYEIEKKIRYNQALRRASWSTADKRWTLEIEQTDTKTTQQLSCGLLFMCSGYYNYDRGYRPDFEGAEDFKGQIVDPQFWPEDLDYADKRIAVIGSGATAMTIVPSIADTAAHVTMVQRSPTYVVSRPDQDAIANFLRKIMPAKWAYAITRFKNVQLQRFMYNRTRSNPQPIKARLLKMVQDELGEDYDVEKHFTPKYNPWDQRLCLVPNGDIFKSIREGKASVVTDHIDRFTESGIQLESGDKVEADIIVTATGLEMKVLGGVEFEMDGEAIDFADTFTYKGMMYSGVPNLVQTFGYVNASWTLRADLNSEFVCRVLNLMDKKQAKVFIPRMREEDRDMPELPWVGDFTPNYINRVMHLFPHQSDRDPWRNTQNYTLDKKIIRHAPLEDGVLTFES